MRKTMNENPVVQVVMLGLLGIVVAFVFMTRVMGGSDPAAEAPATDAAAATLPGGVTPPPAAETGAPTASAPAAPIAVDDAGGAFEAGPGLPKSLVSAYASGDVVVLLIQQDKGIEDRKLRRDVEGLRSRGDTSVFVVDAKDVSDYSRIAEGVNLDRIPAIVVIHPKGGKGAESGGLPVASISYGYRGPDSVEQAVRDALYEGKRLPYHPG